jgi:hypothetical protein
MTNLRTAPTEAGNLDSQKFPDPGFDRFFVVKHRPHRTLPVVVELRETLTAGRRVVGMSTLLGFDYTHADPATIYKIAAEVEARVGKVDQCVGVYGR